MLVTVGEFPSQKSDKVPEAEPSVPGTLSKINSELTTLLGSNPIDEIYNALGGAEGKVVEVNALFYCRHTADPSNAL